MLNTNVERDLAAIRGQLAEVIVLLRVIADQTHTKPPARKGRKTNVSSDRLA